MAFVLTKSTNYAEGANPEPLHGSPAEGTAVTVYDSGSIVTIPQPGKTAAPKLTDGTQQSATTASCDSTVVGGGNSVTKAQVPTYGPAGNSLGYSILGE